MLDRHLGQSLCRGWVRFKPEDLRKVRQRAPAQLSQSHNDKGADHRPESKDLPTLSASFSTMILSRLPSVTQR